MSLNQIASEVFKHPIQTQLALQGLRGLTQMTGSASSAAFGKIFEKLSSPSSSASTPSGNNSSSQGLNTLQALSGLAYFDADRNGQVTKQELSTGLQKLSQMGLTHSGVAQLNQFGQNLLQNYSQVVALDGHSGSISYQDLSKLANLDGKNQSISLTDWQKVHV